MMAALRTWLLSVTAAAFAVALAQALTPAGTVKKVGKLVGGLVLLLAVVRPVLRLDVDDLAIHAAFYDPAPAAELRQSALGAHIADSTAAYITQQAAELGFACSAVVEVETDADGWPVPAAVQVTGTMTASQRQALSALLISELNIPAERQIFREGGS